MDWGKIDYTNLANGILVFIIGLLTWLGIRGGRQKAAQPVEAQLAGAIVDSSSVRLLVDAIKEQTSVRQEGQKQAKDNAHMLARRIEALADGCEEMTSELRSLREEMIRKR